MALWIKADGTEQEVKPADNKRFTLDELQKFVGGDIELTHTAKPKRVMYVNEEGMLRGLPINAKATALISPDYLMIDGIRGDVIVLEKGKRG